MQICSYLQRIRWIRRKNMETEFLPFLLKARFNDTRNEIHRIFNLHAWNDTKAFGKRQRISRWLTQFAFRCTFCAPHLQFHSFNISVACAYLVFLLLVTHLDTFSRFTKRNNIAHKNTPAVTVRHGATRELLHLTWWLGFVSPTFISMWGVCLCALHPPKHTIFITFAVVNSIAIAPVFYRTCDYRKCHTICI